jgi:hypothetical protein
MSRLASTDEPYRVTVLPASRMLGNAGLWSRIRVSGPGPVRAMPLRDIVAAATSRTTEYRVKAFALIAENQPAILTDLADPELAPDAALIRIHAASVNGFDVYQASGGLMAMMPHELPTVVGRDLSGVVESVGAARTDVAPGDEVLGFVQSAPPLHLGTWAEAVAGGDKLILARKPSGIDWVTAAAIPLAASTALDAVDAVVRSPVTPSSSWVRRAGSVRSPSSSPCNAAPG